MKRGGGSLLRAAAVAFLVVAAAGIVARRFTRYAVAGESMHPTLAAGEFVIATRHAHSSRVRPGDVVLAVDPREPARVIVKRVGAVDAAGVWLAGDNPGASTDSRTFGPVDPAGVLGRVVAVYWPPRAVRLVR
ncbi:MAG: hypothetical protein Kow0010_23390 [Dehalococcoidia bacterium]